MNLPTSVNILGVEYSIEYVDKPSDVDRLGRESLLGSVDHWDRSIRVYAKDLSSTDIFGTIMEEVLHAIGEIFGLDMLNSEDNHDQLGLLALALADILTRNGWTEFDVDY